MHTAIIILIFGLLNRYAMRYLSAVLFTVVFTIGAFAQYSNMDMGMMRVNYKRNSILKDSWWTGFNVNVAGFTFSRYGGSIALRDTFPGQPEGWEPQGNFFHASYTKTFTNLTDQEVKEGMKTPLFVPYVGFGFGGWRTHNRFSMATVNLSMGTSINIWRGLALYGGLNTGFRVKKFDADWQDPLITDVESAIPTMYAHFNFGVRVHYSIGTSVKGIASSKEYYHAPGWYNYQYESGGFIYSGRGYSEGGTYADYAILTTNEIVSVAPVVYFTKGADGSGPTKAFGGKVTARTGLINADVQYMRGQVGFKMEHGSFAGNNTNLSYWNMSQASFALGINAFNLFAPFKGPSVYRCIVGYRFGLTNMEAVYVVPNSGLLPPAPNEQKEKTRSFFIAAEIGRFGMSWDFYKSKVLADNKTGGTLSVYYMIPIVKS